MKSCVLALLLAGTTAYAQSPREINRILSGQREWKLRQLPANAVLRQFEARGMYSSQELQAAMAYRGMKKGRVEQPIPRVMWPGESDKPVAFARAFSRPAIPVSSPPVLRDIQMSTSFMQWLVNYRPEWAAK